PRITIHLSLLIRCSQLEFGMGARVVPASSAYPNRHRPSRSLRRLYLLLLQPVAPFLRPVGLAPGVVKRDELFDRPGNLGTDEAAEELFFPLLQALVPAEQKRLGLGEALLARQGLAEPEAQALKPVVVGVRHLELRQCVAQNLFRVGVIP